MSYIAARPRVLFSYPGKPPVLTGSKSINDMSQDETSGFMRIHEICGGNRATKRSIISKLKPIIGEVDWDDNDMDTPLDLGKFFNEFSKLQCGQRCAALCWYQAEAEGTKITTDPKAVMLTRTKYLADPTAKSAVVMVAEAKAQACQLEIENSMKMIEAEMHKNAAEVRMRQLASEISKSETRVIVPKSKPVGPTVGREPQNISTWKKIFDFVDKDGSGTVTKAKVQSALAPLTGAFTWEDDDDETPLSFSDFVDQMTLNTPVEKRYSTLHWARTECPDKVYPAGGGVPYFTTSYLVVKKPSAINSLRKSSFGRSTTFGEPAPVGTYSGQQWAR